MTSPSDPIGIGWRLNARPYIVLVSDEIAQNWNPMIDESAIAANVRNCRVGNCQPGDYYEFFAIVPSVYFYQWNSIVLNNPDHFIDIEPVSAQRYADELRNKVLSNVCVP